MAFEDRLRTRIALEAARIMAEEGIDEPGLAKRKAAARLGVADHRNLPRREEIEAALVEHQRLFGHDYQPQHLAKLRTLALEAMRFLAVFSPLLTGSVWSGGAGRHSPIRLYLYPPAPEDVILKLVNANIPYEEKSHSVSRDAGGGHYRIAEVDGFGTVGAGSKPAMVPNPPNKRRFWNPPLRPHLL